MSGAIGSSQRSSSKLLMLMGVLWLLLAAATLVVQFTSPSQVEITWETATEVNTAGFYLYRAQSADGEFTLINEDALIQARGDAVSGAKYTFIDKNVQAGMGYYYVLEEVEFDSRRNRYEDDMFYFEVPRTSWWVPVLIAASTVIGLGLLITGMREDRI